MVVQQLSQLGFEFSGHCGTGPQGGSERGGIIERGLQGTPMLGGERRAVIGMGQAQSTFRHEAVSLTTLQGLKGEGLHVELR